ncbi:hypothetical protein ABN763_12345 [Spongiivirga sp. MCCC 1A20706]|uniref:hypothetical protein n=1 Tax=Spongiivirga sp. MCCC 1A20706 TaxID=3160963 RepID=UPI00397755EE
MKTQLFKSLLIALLIPVFAFSYDGGWKGRYTKEKKIKKEYTVSPNATLKINNSYGHVNVTSWNENRIVIEVHVKTNGNNEEKVQRKLEEIDVNFEASNNLVSARTIFNKDKGSSWWKWTKNNNVNMQINYTVKMPVTNDANLNNDYGSISLDKIEGVATISCDYGKITLGELMADGNYLNFDYTSKSTIAYMKSGKINADYSGFTLDKAESVVINADYTQSAVENVKKVEYNCDYGSLKVKEVNDFKGTGDYLTTRLGTVHGDVSIRSDYGSVKIEKMDSDAGNIDIRSDYTGIRIGYAPDYHFDFELTLEYAGVSGDDDDFEYIRKVSKSSDKFYSGYYGKQNSGNKVIINSEYGGIKFEKQF